jgi:hypothetical protein
MTVQRMNLDNVTDLERASSLWAVGSLSGRDWAFSPDLPLTVLRRDQGRVEISGLDEHKGPERSILHPSILSFRSLISGGSELNHLTSRKRFGICAH